jgi:hypothetical protein
METKELVSMHVSIHEDNAWALILTETIPPQFTPRSKYYAIKTVWFREEIQKQGDKLLKIETVQQLCDMFTKGLARPTFEYLTKKVIWWWLIRASIFERKCWYLPYKANRADMFCVCAKKWHTP